MLSNILKNKTYKKRFSFSIINIIDYFGTLNMFIPHSWVSLIGFSLFMILIWQIISGFLLSVGFIPEPTLIPAIRETEDLEDFYIDDIFWIHERGVDFLYILIYTHLFRKMFINNISHETESSWKSGAAGYLLLQVVVFFGLVLCSTHLSDITLKIAAHMVASLTKWNTEWDWIIFTDRTLNSDSLIRMMILHYLTAGLFLLLGFLHGIEMHYDWKSDTYFMGSKESINWFEEGLTNEITKFIIIMFTIVLINKYVFTLNEALSYDIFMWGDIGFTLDVNFFGVSPHWYFRPFMAWLSTIPSHYMGLFGIVVFFLSIFFQPNLVNIKEEKPILSHTVFYKNELDSTQINSSTNNTNLTNHYNLKFYYLFILFIFSLWYASSFLPFGKYFHSIGGNFGLVIADIIIFFYLLFPSFRGNYNFGYIMKFYSNILLYSKKI